MALQGGVTTCGAVASTTCRDGLLEGIQDKFQTQAGVTELQRTRRYLHEPRVTPVAAAL